MSYVELLTNARTQGKNSSSHLLEPFADELRSRLEGLPFTPLNILEINAGNGQRTHALQLQYPNAKVVGLESSEWHLTQARQTYPNLIFMQGTPSALPFESQSMDLIFVHLMPLWLPEGETQLRECERILKKEGAFVFTTFGPETLKELRFSFEKIDAAEHIDAFCDLQTIGDALLKIGFREPVVDREISHFIYPDVFTLLYELKNSGSMYSGNEPRRGLTTPHVWKKLEAHYREQMTEKNKVTATLEMIYGMAWKKNPQLKNSFKEVSIPIERIQKRK